MEVASLRFDRPPSVPRRESERGDPTSVGVSPIDDDSVGVDGESPDHPVGHDPVHVASGLRIDNPDPVVVPNDEMGPERRGSVPGGEPAPYVPGPHPLFGVDVVSDDPIVRRGGDDGSTPRRRRGRRPVERQFEPKPSFGGVVPCDRLRTDCEYRVAGQDRGDDTRQAGVDDLETVGGRDRTRSRGSCASARGTAELCPAVPGRVEPQIVRLPRRADPTATAGRDRPREEGEEGTSSHTSLTPTVVIYFLPNTTIRTACSRKFRPLRTRPRRSSPTVYTGCRPTSDR